MTLHRMLFQFLCQRLQAAAEEKRRNEYPDPGGNAAFSNQGKAGWLLRVVPAGDPENLQSDGENRPLDRQDRCAPAAGRTETAH